MTLQKNLPVPTNVKISDGCTKLCHIHFQFSYTRFLDSSRECHEWFSASISTCMRRWFIRGCFRSEWRVSCRTTRNRSLHPPINTKLNRSPVPGLPG